MRQAALASALAALVLALVVSASASALALLPGSEGFNANVYAEDGDLAKDAGSHPGVVSFSVNFETEGGGPLAKGDLRNLSLEMPPGLIENPTALRFEYCSVSDFATPRNSPFEASESGESCPDVTQIGTVEVRSLAGGAKVRTFGLFNLAPKHGEPAAFGASPYGEPLVLVPSIRQAEGEYGMTLRGTDIAQTLDISGLTVTIWGIPWGLLEPKELVEETPKEKIFQELIRHDKQLCN